MNKKVSRILSLAIALIMCMAMAAPALALEGSSNGADGKVATSVVFDKNLVMDSKANVPAKTFSFTLSGANPATSSTTSITARPGIVAGVKVDTNTILTDEGKFTISFAGTEGTKTGSPANDGEKYATKSFTLDFSGVNFTEPGVYRYTLVETASATGTNNDADVTYSTTTYYIDVYVEYEKTAGEDPAPDTWAETLTIGSIVVATSPLAVDGATEDYGDKKVDASGPDSAADFNNNLKTYDLDIDKQVTGNQGEHNKEFTFTLKLEGVPENAQYTVTFGEGTAANAGNSTLATSMKTTAANASGVSETTFTLKNKQKITIENLPHGAKWTVTENDYSSNGYTTTNVVDSTASENGRVASNTTTGIAADTDVTFTNKREGTIPTGVLLTIAPFVALMVVAVVGAVVVLKKKKN